MKRNKKFMLAIIMMASAFMVFTTSVVSPMGEPVIVQAATKSKAKVSISQTKSTICPKKILQLKVKGTSKKVTWKSGKPSIAKVTSKGKVTGVKAGTTVISAKVDGKTYKCTVKVRNHSYSKATCTKPAICKYCKAIKGQVLEHKFSEATCIEPATCMRCGSIDGTELGHDYRSTVVEATKSARGYTNHICDRCKTSYKDAYTDYKPTPDQVFTNITALQNTYKEGMPWTNSNYYDWNGGIYSGGYGCAGFAFLLSDEAFGYLPARKHENFSNIKVGDILRINNDTHSVVVLEVQVDGVTIAEGNYNGAIHWGRTLSYEKIQETGIYVLTRYSE